MVDSLRQWRDRIEDYKENLLEQEGQPLDCQDIDIGYHVRTSPRSSQYWQESPHHRAPNGICENQEILNHVLARPDLSRDLEETLDLEVPWVISVENQTDPQISGFLETVDIHIQAIQSILDQRFQENRTNPAYQLNLAAALFAFCLLAENPNTENQVQPAVLRFLERSDLEEYRTFLQNQTNHPPLGIKENLQPEENEGDVTSLILTRQGNCTELSYLYRFIAQRAGLEVDFAEVDTTGFGRANHLCNRLVLSDSSVVYIDLGLTHFSQDRSENINPLDDYQALALYYGQKARNDLGTEKNQETSSQAQNAKELYAIALALDPENAYLRAKYAEALAERGDIEAAKQQFEEALTIGIDGLYPPYVLMAEFFQANPTAGHDPNEYARNALSLMREDLLENPVTEQNYSDWYQAFKMAHLCKDSDFINRYIEKFNMASRNQAVTYGMIFLHIELMYLQADPDQLRMAYALAVEGWPEDSGFTLGLKLMDHEINSEVISDFLDASSRNESVEFQQNILRELTRKERPFPEEALGYLARVRSNHPTIVSDPTILRLKLLAETQIELRSARIQFHRNQVGIALRTSNHNQALHSLKVLMNLEPELATYFFTAARLYAEMEQTNNTIDLLRVACEIDNSQPICPENGKFSDEIFENE